MTYTHFGKQADVLKHLLLCELLRIEKPRVYVETNAACAQYALEKRLNRSTASTISEESRNRRKRMYTRAC